MQNQSAAHDSRKSAQVLPFRRPGTPLSVVPTSEPPQPRSTDDDFAHYQQDREELISDRQRMLMNMIAIAIVVLLITVGVWIADTIQISTKKEDCALQGRTNCEPIELPARR